MPRCLTSVLASLAMAAPALLPSAVMAQGVSTDTLFLGRAVPIPTNSLRAEIVFGQPPEVLVNGQAARLAPGVHIRDMHNRLVLSASLTGQKLKANYTLDTLGLVMNVWILNASEAAQLWPTTAAEASTWAFDPVTHTWTKP